MDDVVLLRSYDDDYLHDNEMKELDAELDACAKEVEVRSGLDRLKKFVSYLNTSSDKTAKKINSYQNEILDAKPGDEREAKEKYLDTVLIDEYLANSSETHDLCLNELKDFIQKAIEMASCIDEEKKSDQEFRKIQMKVEEGAKEVIKKIDTLLNQHIATLDKLNEKMKNQKGASILRKVLNVIFIGSLSAAFVCSVIMATAMAVPSLSVAFAAQKVLKTIIASGAVVQTLSPAIKRAHSWLDKTIKDHESNLKAQKVLTVSTQIGTLEIIEELKNIRCHVEKVNEAGKGVSEGCPSEKLEKFKDDIKKLETATANCVEVIEKASAEVANKYEELKKKVHGQNNRRGGLL